MSQAFRYMIEFESFVNPPGKYEQFCQLLHEFARSRNLDCGQSALGGSIRTYGDVRRPIHGVTEADRQSFIDFIQKQPIKGTARIGPLESETTTTESFGLKITHCVFEVDNLTDADRAEAAEYREKIMAFVNQARKPK